MTYTKEQLKMMYDNAKKKYEQLTERMNAGEQQLEGVRAVAFNTMETADKKLQELNNGITRIREDERQNRRT